jgi:CRP-like cAMP-binding protein
MASPNDLDLASELRLIPSFAEVAKDALSELALSSTQKRAHAGTPLVDQGLVSPNLVMLLRGAAKTVRVIKSDSAKGEGVAASNAAESVVVLDVMRAPCVVADASIIDGQAATASVITLRSSHVALLDRRHLTRLLAAHASLSRALLARLASEMRARVRRIDEIVAGPVDERVKHLLDSLALEHGTPLGQGRFIAIPLRRRDLANMVNATTETVSRLLAKFEREGHARSTRDGIWWRSAGTTAPKTSPSTRRPSDHPDSHPAPASTTAPTSTSDGHARDTRERSSG